MHIDRHSKIFREREKKYIPHIHRELEKEMSVNLRQRKSERREKLRQRESKGEK